METHEVDRLTLETLFVAKHSKVHFVTTKFIHESHRFLHGTYVCISSSTLLIILSGSALVSNSFNFFFTFICYHNFFILHYLTIVKNMSMLLNNVLDIQSQGIILTTKTTLFLLLVLFVSLMRDYCHDIFKVPLKDFSTFLSLCSLPIK